MEDLFVSYEVCGIVTVNMATNVDYKPTKYEHCNRILANMMRYGLFWTMKNTILQINFLMVDLLQERGNQP